MVNNQDMIVQFSGYVTCSLDTKCQKIFGRLSKHDNKTKHQRNVLLKLTQPFMNRKYLFRIYSKSQIFVQKFNFDKTPTFSRVFHPIFLTIFLVKSKLSTAKKSKTTTFSRVFHPKKNRKFSREIKVDFEQCEKIETFLHIFKNSLSSYLIQVRKFIGHYLSSRQAAKMIRKKM